MRPLCSIFCPPSGRARKRDSSDWISSGHFLRAVSEALKPGRRHLPARVEPVRPHAKPSRHRIHLPVERPLRSAIGLAPRISVCRVARP